MAARARKVCAIAVVYAALAAVHDGRAHAQAPETGIKGVVRVRAKAIRADESRGVGGIPVWYEFVPGESASFLVTAGHSDRENRELCSAGSSGPLNFLPADQQANIAHQEATALYIWHIDVRMIEVRASSMAVDVSWQRTSRGGPDERLQYSQRLVLQQDESRVIDLIHTPPGGDCLGVVVEVEAGITDAPALAAKAVEWDLWASTGPKTSARQKIRSAQGETAAFMFDALAIPGSDNDEYVVFAGTVTGRARQDGNVDIAIDVRPMTTTREKAAERIATMKNQGQRGSNVTALRKDFTAKPGEAVKIVVPMFLQRKTTNPANGRSGFAMVEPVYEMSITVQALVR
jgi:hypothetical protein